MCEKRFTKSEGRLDELETTSADKNEEKLLAKLLSVQPSSMREDDCGTDHVMLK